MIRDLSWVRCGAARARPIKNPEQCSNRARSDRMVEGVAVPICRYHRTRQDAGVALRLPRPLVKVDKPEVTPRG